MKLIDPTGSIVSPAERIVSLVPSLTESLFELGAGERVVAVSQYCTRPVESLKQLPRIGGPKNPSIDAIVTMKPDLIVMNREENRKPDYERLALHAPVYVSDVKRLSDVPDLIRDLGAMTDCERESNRLASRIEDESGQIPRLFDQIVTAVPLIWRQPMMTANGDCYLGDVLRRCGILNPYHLSFERYPVVTIDSLVEVSPDWILFPSEPYEWKEEEIADLCHELAARGIQPKPLRVDGETLTWYGARSLIALTHFLPDLIRKLHGTASE